MTFRGVATATTALAVLAVICAAVAPDSIDPMNAFMVALLPVVGVLALVARRHPRLVLTAVNDNAGTPATGSKYQYLVDQLESPGHALPMAATTTIELAAVQRIQCVARIDARAPENEAAVKALVSPEVWRLISERPRLTTESAAMILDELEQL